jgi:hypothetical protein
MFDVVKVVGRYNLDEIEVRNSGVITEYAA